MQLSILHLLYFQGKRHHSLLPSPLPLPRNGTFLPTFTLSLRGSHPLHPGQFLPGNRAVQAVLRPGKLKGNGAFSFRECLLHILPYILFLFTTQEGKEEENRLSSIKKFEKGASGTGVKSSRF